MKDVDLEPQNWVSDRDKPREPIFGPGWPLAVGVVLSIVAAAVLTDGTIFMKFIGGIIGAVIMSIALALTAD